MQEIVGGFIEVVYLENDEVMIIDDDGKGKNKPVNAQATIRATRDKAIFNNDWIAGDVIIMDKDLLD